MDNVDIYDLHLKTGDLLLFSYESNGFFGAFTKMIQWGTHSNYSHVGMIIKDPKFNNMPPLKGIFVWESSYENKKDPQDGKIKLGVQITPLHEILETYKNKGHVFLRRLNINTDILIKCSHCDNKLTTVFTNDLINEIHETVYDKPYDIVPLDWIEAFFKVDSHPQKTDRFWCAALVGYIYTKANIVNKNTDWSILTPNDFSLSGENLQYVGPHKLDNKIIKIQ